MVQLGARLLEEVTKDFFGASKGWRGLCNQPDEIILFLWILKEKNILSVSSLKCLILFWEMLLSFVGNLRSWVCFQFCIAYCLVRLTVMWPRFQAFGPLFFLSILLNINLFRFT